MQRPHGVDDGPPGAMRPSSPAVSRLDLLSIASQQIEVAERFVSPLGRSINQQRGLRVLYPRRGLGLRTRSRRPRTRPAPDVYQVILMRPPAGLPKRPAS